MSMKKNVIHRKPKTQKPSAQKIMRNTRSILKKKRKTDYKNLQQKISDDFLLGLGAVITLKGRWETGFVFP